MLPDPPCCRCTGHLIGAEWRHCVTVRGRGRCATGHGAVTQIDCVPMQHEPATVARTAPQITLALGDGLAGTAGVVRKPLWSDRGG
jgi:hypothetical protein